MNDLTTFTNPEFGQVRTVEIDGTPWLVGKDVAEALGYKNPTKAIIAHVDDEDKRFEMLPQEAEAQNGTLPSGSTKTALINESGLYSLVLSSKLPTAKKFRRWVTSEVLPSIRKHGGYIAGQEQLTPQELMAKALLVANKTLTDREARISELTAQNSQLAVDKQIMQPKAFVDWLLSKKYIYRDQKSKLMPYEGKNNGLFEVKECFNEKTQWGGVQTLITPKGRETFRLLCLKAG